MELQKELFDEAFENWKEELDLKNAISKNYLPTLDYIS
mgnify:CR=1 FL=1